MVDMPLNPTKPNQTTPCIYAYDCNPIKNGTRFLFELKKQNHFQFNFQLNDNFSG